MHIELILFIGLLLTTMAGRNDIHSRLDIVSQETNYWTKNCWSWYHLFREKIPHLYHILHLYWGVCCSVFIGPPCIKWKKAMSLWVSWLKALKNLHFKSIIKRVKCFKEVKINVNFPFSNVYIKDDQTAFWHDPWFLFSSLSRKLSLSGRSCSILFNSHFVFPL